MTTPALSASGLCKRFAGKGSQLAVDALTDVSFEMAAGTLTALVGPDGAGKTTLLRLVAGLMTADSGRLSVLGLDAATQAQQIQNRISYMPQRFGLYDDLSVQENLDLYADLHGVPAALRRERYARLLHMTDLARFTGRPAGKLSGGMKQKLGLACTLVRSPELLLLDEPTVGVDPLSRRELWEIVQQLVGAEQLSVIVATSYLDEAEHCAQVLVLRDGRLLAQGAPEAIRARADALVSVVTPHAGEAARTLQARLYDDPGTTDAVPLGGEVRLIRRTPAPAELLAGAAVRQVDARLEDGFMTLLHAAHLASEVPRPAPPLAAVSPAEPRDVVIEVRDLVRRFGDFTAVNGIGFSVRRGEIFGLLGPNGAGKTTTFRMLCGLLPASSGYLRVAGVDLRHAPAEARRQIGYVSQKFALYGNLSVRENLHFFGGAYGLYGKELAARIEVSLREFALADQADTPSGQLPGGYRQRLAMATALLHRPSILFLDEPTSGADPLARRAFWHRITALAAAGTTIIVTTHFMEEAEYCDRIAIQDAGNLLALGTPLEVRRQAGGEGGLAADMDAAFIGIVEQERRRNAANAAEAA
ncbi:MAG: ABC transporter ATP-binding protein [Burkholderiaceae bacterium]|nr:ABC transporter ATP-binding protein [Burkholderiaceae bacterium]